MARPLINTNATFKSGWKVLEKWLDDVDRSVYQAIGTGVGVGTAPKSHKDVRRNLNLPINVKSYGAVGDGVTDDTVAIQAALDDGGTRRVIFDGTFLINSSITCTVDDIEIDFGSSVILNTSAITPTTIYGESSSAVFNFTGNRVKIKGGFFKDGLSEGIRITGVFAGETFIGPGYTEGHLVENVQFDNWELRSVQARFVKQSVFRGIKVRDKGAGNAAGHDAEIAFKYATDVLVDGCSVEQSNNGGGVYGLYVDKYTVQGCSVDITNSLALQTCVGYYFSYCNDVNLTGSQGYCLTGGACVKGSHGTNIMVSANRFENASASGTTNAFACVQMQGVVGYQISDNYCKGYAQHVIYIHPHTIPANLNARDGIIANNDIVAVILGTSRVAGDGIYINQGTSVTRGGVKITGNRLFDGSIYLLQAGGVDVEQCQVDGNTLTITDDPLTTAACIWIDRCYGVHVSNNYVFISDATVETTVGIYNSSGSYITIQGNMVVFAPNAKTGSIAYLQDGSPTANIVWWEDNKQMRAETPFSGMGAVSSRIEKISADFGDAATTLVAGVSVHTNVWNTAITADRAVTLSTTGAYAGAKFRIIRTANATGAFNLNVGTGPLKAMSVAGSYCDVEYNGDTSAWMLTAYGTL